MAKKYTSEEWEQMLIDYKNSGMTAKAWCISRNIKERAMYYWRKRLNTVSKEPEWGSLQLGNHLYKTKSPTITLKIRDFKLEIACGFDKATLEDVLKVVMQLC